MALLKYIDQQLERILALCEISDQILGWVGLLGLPMIIAYLIIKEARHHENAGTDTEAH